MAMPVLILDRFFTLRVVNPVDRRTPALICSNRSYFPQLLEQKSLNGQHFSASTLLAKGINQKKNPDPLQQVSDLETTDEA